MHASLSFPFKLSQYPFSQGLPGSIYNVFAPTPANHCRSCLATNSGPVVRTDVLRDTVHQHHIGQGLDQIVTVQPPCYPDRQALPGVLVNQSQHPQGSPIVGAGADEVVTPDVILPLRPPPPPPDPLHPVLAHTPARLAQLHGDPAIPVTSVLAGQLQNGPGEAILVVVLRRNIQIG